MPKKIKTLIIGLGEIGLHYDYHIKKNSYLTHSSTVNNHPHFNLLCGVDLQKKNRELFEKKFLKKTYSNLGSALRDVKADLIIISYECKNVLSVILKILENNKPKFILFEKPFITNINHFLKIKEILLKNKIDFRVNFQRSFNKRYTQTFEKIFRNDNDKKIIISYTGKFLSNAVHYLFLLSPFINKIKIVKKNKNFITIATKNLEIFFIKLKFDYSMNKMEIFSNDEFITLTGRDEKFNICIKSKDKLYNGVNILKNKEVINLNSKFNQKIVMDEISKFTNNHYETIKFCKKFEKYLSTLNKIIK